MPDLIHSNHSERPSIISTNPVIQLTLLIAVVVLVFSPGIFAEYCLVDDANVVAGILSDHDVSLKTIFLPGLKEGGYYRPLIGLSQYLDKILWGMNPWVTHLENILLHLFNVCCLYFVIRIVLSRGRQPYSHYGALLAALLFAMHPLVTESVFWYSGRTDLVATAFILPALCVLLIWQQSRENLWLLVAASVLLFLAALAKESAFAIILALPLLFVSIERDTPSSPAPQPGSWRIYAVCLIPSLVCALFFFKFIPAVVLMAICIALLMRVKHHHNTSSWQSGIKRLVLFGALLGVVALLFLSLRHVVFHGASPRIKQTLVLMTEDVDYTIGLFIGAVGFYVKKFFLPLPLNFTLREIDPLYQLVGIVVLFGAIALSFRRTQAAIYALVGLVLLTPAFPFVFGTIAWTSYAERYVYLSLAFWTGALVLAAEGCRYRWSAQSILLAVVVVMAVISFQRGRVWQTNIGILGDTVKKTPGFRDIRGFYLQALYLKGDLKEAEEQYRAAMAIPSDIYNPRIDIVYAQVLRQQGRTEAALQLLERVDRKTGGKIKEIRSLRKEYLDGYTRSTSDKTGTIQ